MLGHDQCVRLLLEGGANVEQPINNGCTSLHIAAQGGHHACLQLLIQANAAIGTEASQNGHAECVRLLLDAGAGATVDRDGDGAGTTALFMASQGGFERCVELLLGARASAALAGADGSTPLHAASEKGSLACVRLLLAARGNPRAQMVRKGETPLSFAAMKGHQQCVAALEASIRTATPNEMAFSRTVGNLRYLFQSVRLVGLTSRPELNGRRGIAMAFNDDAERYSVQIDGMRDLLKVRPVNLELWTTPEVTIIEQIELAHA